MEINPWLKTHKYKNKNKKNKLNKIYPQTSRTPKSWITRYRLKFIFQKCMSLIFYVFMFYMTVTLQLYKVELKIPKRIFYGATFIVLKSHSTFIFQLTKQYPVFLSSFVCLLVKNLNHLHHWLTVLAGPRATWMTLCSVTNSQNQNYSLIPS